MTSTADASDVVEVADDGVSITKTYAAEEFPVPAIKFELTTERDEPVTVRVTEDIPSSFSMDGIGFHPDYHSDQWTAYQDNRVEFTGQVDPDAPLVTVYGVKLDDDHQPSEFLTEPTIADVRSVDSEPEDLDPDERPDPVADTTIDDIVSEDRNQVVKDMLTGESTGVPGLDDDEDADDIEAGDDLDLDLSDVDTDPVEVDDRDDEGDDAPDIDLNFEEEIPEPAPATDEGDQVAGDEPEISLDLDAAAESLSDDEPEAADDAPEAAADESEAAADEVAESPPTSVDEGEEDADGDAASEVSLGTDELADEAATVETTDDDQSPVDSGVVDEAHDSVVAAFAAEIRAGSISEDDLSVLEDALGGSENTPERARIDHLQSRVEAVAAYTSALESFLEEEGTGEQLIREFRSQLETFESELDAATGRLDETESTVSSLASSVEDVESTVDRTDETVADLSEEVDDFEEDLSAVTTTVDDLDAAVSDLDEDVSGLDEDVDELDDTVEDLAEEVDDLDEDLSDVDERVTDLVEWRDQLGSMFSD